MSGLSFLEIPEDPPRLGNPLQRRISALLVDATMCVGDPRAMTRDDASSRELDVMVAAGLVQVLDRSVIEAAATEQATAKRSFAPADATLDRFTALVSRLGAIEIQGANKIFMPGYDFVGDSRWFPADRFQFERPFTRERVLEATRLGGPQLVVRRIAETMYERTAAQLATLQLIAEGQGTDLVSTDAVAPMFRAIEESTRGDADAPMYISAGVDLLVSTILRHAQAIERLEDMPIEEVADLGVRLSAPRRAFQAVVRAYVDEVLESDEPEKAATKIYRKRLEPEIAAFDESFGNVFRTVRTYAVDTLRSPTALSLLPLAALGLVAGANTAWTLAANAAYSMYRTTKARRVWPRLLFELRSRG